MIIKELSRRKHERKSLRDKIRKNQDIAIVKNLHMAKYKANNILTKLVKNKVDRKVKLTEKTNKVKAIITSFAFIY